MEVRFTKLSDVQHAVTVTRADGSTERVVLDSRSYLRHDLAHWAVETTFGLRAGVWGSVAAGGSLSGDGLDGADMALAERLSGPVQTLMRTEAGPDEIAETLRRVHPDPVTDDLAPALHERLRQLRGHWKATPYGADMVLEWPFD